MIDYFALLEQPRRPRIDLDQLKEKYHQLSRATQPNDAAALNEAYRILREPKLRLKHLLELENISIESGPVPQDLADVFLETGTLIQNLDRLLALHGTSPSDWRTRSTNTALNKALLRSELSDSRKTSDLLLAKLKQLYDDAVRDLELLDGRWSSPNELSREISELGSRFAYLTRWIDQLEERKLQLAMSDLPGESL